jgi:prolyl-tRNA editing enzyme YbaK/EbsC (Cys-tRNA(Pro) deacylase)
MRSSVDVHNFLLERDVPHELVPLTRRLPSPNRWAGALGLPPEQVGRVVMFEGPDGPVAALVRSDDSPDPSRLAEVAEAGSLAEMAPARATDLTGFLSEVIPPAGLPAEVTVVVDRLLAEQEVLYFPGGESSSVLKIRARDLTEATGALVASITP